MPKYELSFHAVAHLLDDEFLLAEPLLCPETSQLGRDAARVRKAIESRVRKTIEQLEPALIHRRLIPERPRIGSIEIAVSPKSRSIGWREPVRLTFFYAHWRHGDEAEIAYVPSLGIEVLIDQPKLLEERLAAEIRLALLRSGLTSSLRDLLWFERLGPLKIKPLRITASVRTPKQIASEEVDASLRKKSVLKEVATKLGHKRLSPAFEVEEVVSQIAESLGGVLPQILERNSFRLTSESEASDKRNEFRSAITTNAQSVLLVGPSGVGKTATFHELVRRRIDFQLGDKSFWSTSGSRLIAGMSGFGMWQERCHALVTEAERTNAIVHLGNLIELFEVGKAGGSATGIAAYLRPYIARGQLLVVVECTAEQLPVVEREDPSLLSALHEIQVAEPTEDRARSILLSCAASWSSGSPKDKRTSKAAGQIRPEALEELDRLHRRYTAYSAYPGRPLRFLRNLLDERLEGQDLTATEVVHAFSRETGLPLFLLDDQIPLDLEETRRWFAERVIGQEKVVELVVDLLATVKARLSRSGRPIASLLFIGPTGVGKTEMAKSLSEFLYQDPNRMIRFDMSEYSDAMSIDRLIGGSVLSQGLLTQKVRQQPFAVVLLDEFEKAHPSFFDLLLQVLGEGRLTDGAGRVADFTNAVVIMTSNLGVDSFRGQAIGFGDDTNATGQYAEHFESKVREFLRPEFFNRIDRIVPFSPLGQDTIKSIARREIDKVLERDGIRYRNVSVGIDEEVVSHLAKAGYQPRYGARALRRAIERDFVTPVAEGLNRYSETTQLEATSQVDSGRVKVTVRGTGGGQNELGGEGPADSSVRNMANRVTEVRRRIQRVDRSSVVLAMRNEITRLKHAISRVKRSQRKGRKTREPYRAMSELAVLQKLVDRVDGLNSEACRLEDEVLLPIYQNKPSKSSELESKCSKWDDRYREMATDVLVSRQQNANQVTLVIFGEDLAHVARLGHMYESLARERDCRLQRYLLTPFKGKQNQTQATEGETKGQLPGRMQTPSMTLKNRKTHASDKQEKIIDAYSVRADDAFWQVPPEVVIGVALQITGDAIRLYMEDEAGIHQLKTKTREVPCLVEAGTGLLIHYDPPRGITRQGAIGKQSRRRTYDLDERTALDETLQQDLTWVGQAIEQAVIVALERNFQRQLEMLFN